MTTSDNHGELSVQILQELRVLRQANEAQARQIRRLENLLRAKAKEPKGYLFLNESAALLDWAPKTARNWRSAGKFPEPDSYTQNGGRKRPQWHVETILEFRASLGGVRWVRNRPKC